MSFHRATIKSLAPLSVLPRGATDAPANWWQVFQSEIDTSAVAVNDEVIVELQGRQVFLRSRIGGVASGPGGGGGAHSDDVQTDVTAVIGLVALGEMRSLVLSWNPPVGGVGHGYYQVQVALQIDPTYSLSPKDFTTTDNFVVVQGLFGSDYRARVRPFGGDGTPGGWTEISPITVRDIISTDIGAGEVNRQAIEQGAIDALRLADGAVSYKKLVIGSFDNLIADPGFESLSVADRGAVVVNSGGVWDVFSDPAIARSGGGVLRFTAAAAIAAQAIFHLGEGTQLQGNVSASSTDVFYGEAYVRAATAGQTAGLRIEFRDEAGALLQAINSAVVTLSTAYQRVSIVATAPAGTAFVRLGARVAPTAAAVTVYFDDAYMRRRIDGNLIVDGTIDAVHLAANSVTAAKIVAGSIRADNGTLGQVDAGLINVGTMNAARIQGGDINGVSITGVTITGGTLQTASFGTRIVISSASNNKISFVGNNGVEQGFVQVRAGFAGGSTGYLDINSQGTISIVANNTEISGNLNVFGDLRRFGSMVAFESHSHSHGHTVSGNTGTTGSSGTTGSATVTPASTEIGTGTGGTGSTGSGGNLSTGIGPNLNNHTHTAPSHTHSGPSHSHAIGLHSHGSSSHTHSTPTHTHNISINI